MNIALNQDATSNNNSSVTKVIESLQGASFTDPLADIIFSPSAKIFYCYPGGNDTHITVSNMFARDSYHRADSLIRAKYGFIEQGGFMEKAENEGAVAHLQMAGGEFCGNATRSIAALLVADYLASKGFAGVADYSRIRRDSSGAYEFSVTVSSAPLPLAIRVEDGSDGMWVKTDMPVGAGLRSVQHVELSADNDTTVPATLVKLDGISHILVNEEDYPFEERADSYSNKVKLHAAQLGLHEEKAVGLIWFREEEGGSTAIRPVVWVRKQDSVYYESACGSGSIALALAALKTTVGQDRLVMDIKQPSGQLINCRLATLSGSDILTECSIAGKVTLHGDLNNGYRETQQVGSGVSLVEARTLKGFPDRLPADALAKKRLVGALENVFESFGYVPIETPHLEYKDVLVKQGSDEIQRQLYSFEDNGHRAVALRFDLTVPLARFCVQHRNELGFPFKRYAIGNVFRGEKPQGGRYREFTQCDFDFVGLESIDGDAEIIQVIGASMMKLGLDDYTIRLNNRKLMNGFARSLGCYDKVDGILREIDKLDKVGEEQVRTALEEKVRLTPGQASSLVKFASIKQDGPNGLALLREMRGLASRDPLMAEGLQEMEGLFGILSGLAIDKNRYKIDMSIARGLGYYTGIVYETVLNKLPSIGSVCSGGRYDSLTQSFSRERLPGVGASVGLDRLLAALEQLEGSRRVATPAAALLLQTCTSTAADVRAYAEQLRAKGLNVEVYPGVSDLRRQYDYAEKKGYEYIIILGEQEIAGDFVTVRRTADKNSTQTFQTFAEVVQVLERSGRQGATTSALVSALRDSK